MAVTRIHILNMIVLAMVGMVILLLSLMTANSLITSGASTPTAGWKFYLGRKILPDNVLYPVIMMNDRIRLDRAAPEDQIGLKLAYANERYATVLELVERQQIPLAVSTFTKYQKYVISAGYQGLGSDTVDTEELELLRAAAETSQLRGKEFSQLHSQLDLGAVNQLQEETRVLLLKLNERISKQ